MNADRLNEHYFGETSNPSTQRCRERIHWICAQARGEKVLDIGCSQGITCLILGREGFECSGIDLEEASLEVARAALQREDPTVRDRVHFETAAATALPYADGSFDTVILGEILEHLAQTDRVLAEARRVLREGGTMVVTVPHGLLPHHDHKQTFYPLSLLEALRCDQRLVTLEVTSHYLMYSGLKENGFDADSCDPDQLLAQMRRWCRSTEERCLQKELELRAARLKLEAGTKASTDELNSLRAEVQQREEALAASKRTVRRLKVLRRRDRVRGKARLAAALRARERELTAGFVLHEQELTSAFAMREQELTGQLGAREAALSERSESRELLQTLRARVDAMAKEVRATRSELGSLRSPRTSGSAPSSLHSSLLVEAMLPRGARVLVISKGEEELVRFTDRSGWHFPQDASGVYAGFHPANAEEAIAHLEALRGQGAEYLLIPGPSLWWLDYYAGFAAHLRARYALCAYLEGKCVLYDLRERVPASHLPDGTPGPIAEGQPEASAGSPLIRHPIASTNGGDEKRKQNLSIPALFGKRLQIDPSKPTLGAILDEFTAGCLRPDSNLVTFRPDNWREAVEAYRPDAIFAESAWKGNEGSWQYRVAKYARDMGNELSDLLVWAREHGIPSIFWNKEDPVHFDRFIERAAGFDHVFTTDARCVPAYRTRLGHDRVHPLPFAAQPALHHPIAEQGREGQVCFAGTYYGDRHEQRRDDMEFLLRPAIDFGLTIYDRQYGLVGKEAEKFRFPEVYQANIKGRLDYDEMVRAYKQHRVFLNVNSVKDSPTMFSRRIFELLACGTPVISTYSRGIVEMLGEDVVFITESAADTRRHLEHLIGDEEAWARASVRGIRKVLSEHTYAHRLWSVGERVGLSIPRPVLHPAAVVAQVAAVEDVDRLAEMLAGQLLPPAEVLLLAADPLAAPATERLSNALPHATVTRVQADSADPRAECRAAATAPYFALVDPLHGYAPHYLHDFALAASYSGAELLGKHSYSESGRDGTARARNPGHEFQYVDRVPISTLVARWDAISSDEFRDCLSGGSFQPVGRRILSIDRFSYLHGAHDSTATRIPVGAQVASYVDA